MRESPASTGLSLFSRLTQAAQREASVSCIGERQLAEPDALREVLLPDERAPVQRVGALDARRKLLGDLRVAGQSLRYHVRLWRVRATTATVTVGAVHHEARVGFFSDSIDKSWEESEEFLRAQLCGPTGCSENPTLATQSGMQGPHPTTGELGVWWRGWYNDARPTVIP